MAYVNFYKGLAADYVAETHQDGIYQCTDTGDTYIFGVKNSGAEGGDTSNLATKEELTQGLAGKADTVHTHTASQVTDLATVATSGSYNDLTDQPSIPTVPGVATSSSNGLMSSTDKAKLDRMESVATRSNLSSVPLAANQIIVASLSANAALSLTGTLGNGQDTHIFVRNTSNSAITITMPSSSTYTNAQDSIEIPGKGYGEINIMHAGGYYFVRAAASE